MKKFIEALEKESNLTKTENGMLASNTTNSALLDIFSSVLSLRNMSSDEIERMWIKAFNENKLYALKLLFYIRSIRTIGQGERVVFRKSLHIIARLYPNLIKPNLELIKDFGRIDDYYALINTPLEDEMFSYLQDLLIKEENGQTNLKVAKWLASINSSNKTTRFFGRKTAKAFHLSLTEYRKLLSRIRKQEKLVENNLRIKAYNDISYQNLPGQAFLKYYKAFDRNDTSRFQEYLKNISLNKMNINTNTLTPYQLVAKYSNDYYYPEAIDPVLETLWNKLNISFSGQHNVLAVVDTSASMYGIPYGVAVSLGIYLSTNNQGVWHNKLVTFSERPRFIELVGETLYEKLKCFPPIYGNTNIEAVFNLILNTALKYNLKQEQMPERIIIISDMQFDTARQFKQTSLLSDELKELYQKYDYELPKLTFWNASPNYKPTFHAYKDSIDVTLVSGISPSLFNMVLNNNNLNPFDFMIEALNNGVFSLVKSF